MIITAHGQDWICDSWFLG